jgi:uncharacterized protein YcaQ
MASLVPFEGWPLRRLIYAIQRRAYEQKIFQDHKEAVNAIMGEIAKRGPLMPKECEFQARNEEWKGSWYGPSITKQTLRALWHSGLVMTAGRKNGQHLYDLTERVVPRQYLEQPMLPEWEAKVELALDRHRAMGLVRPNASAEVWSYTIMYYDKKELVKELVKRDEIVPVDIEGVVANAPPEFLSLLDQPSLEPRVVFIAPLDQFMWDRKMIAHIFGFDYVWEIYMPEAKRKWGYYVLPVLYGDNLVARVEFYCREGILEIRNWHWEVNRPSPTFFAELEQSLRDFMAYSSSTSMRAEESIDAHIRDLAHSM